MRDWCENILHNYTLNTRNEYTEGKITKEEIVSRMKRCNDIKHQYTQWKKTREELKYRRDRIHRHFTEASKENAIFVGIDTGYGFNTGILHDVGLTVYKNGDFTTHLFNLEDMPFEDIQNLCQDFCEKANFTIFHAAHADLNKLKLDTTRFRYFDTSYLSWYWYRSGDRPSLLDLCKMFGVNIENWHKSDVDSRITLEVFFKMREAYFQIFPNLVSGVQFFEMPLTAVFSCDTVCVGGGP